MWMGVEGDGGKEGVQEEMMTTLLLHKQKRLFYASPQPFALSPHSLWLLVVTAYPQQSIQWAHVPQILLPTIVQHGYPRIQ